MHNIPSKTVLFKKQCILLVLVGTLLLKMARYLSTITRSLMIIRNMINDQYFSTVTRSLMIIMNMMNARNIHLFIFIRKIYVWQLGWDSWKCIIILHEFGEPFRVKCFINKAMQYTLIKKKDIFILTLLLLILHDKFKVFAKI